VCACVCVCVCVCVRMMPGSVRVIVVEVGVDVAVHGDIGREEFADAVENAVCKCVREREVDR